MLPRSPLLLALTCALFLSAGAHAQDYTSEPIRIPMPGAGANGLEGLVVRERAFDRRPLVVISHGSPREAKARRTMAPGAFLPQAIEFARRGFAVLVLMRRGYGDSGGNFAEGIGPCADPDYPKAVAASAADIRAAIAHMARRPDIDGARVLSVGQSAGGFASVALASDPPTGLVAGINFAGGRGSRTDGVVCQDARLVEAFRTLGRRARTPMLWVYAENDSFFGPALAQRFREAYTSGGARVDFVAALPYARDGHSLFPSPGGIPIWTPIVDRFLTGQKLVLRERLPPPPPRPTIAPPAQLSEAGKRDFENYLISGPHKAFAISASGSYGWRSGQRSAETARAGALQFCGQRAKDCRLIAVDDSAVK